MPSAACASCVYASTKPGYPSQSWRFQENWTQQRGDAWHARLAAPLLRVPSAVVPLRDSPDEIVVINHRHPAATAIRIAGTEPFALDMRLF